MFSNFSPFIICLCWKSLCSCIIWAGNGLAGNITTLSLLFTQRMTATGKYRKNIKKYIRQSRTVALRWQKAIEKQNNCQNPREISALSVSLTASTPLISAANCSVLLLSSVHLFRTVRPIYFPINKNGYFCRVIASSYINFEWKKEKWGKGKKCGKPFE